MAAVGQLRVPKSLPEAWCRRTSYPSYLDGDTLKHSHASFSLLSSLAILRNGEYEHLSSQLGSRRQIYASGAIPRNSANGSANHRIDVDGYRSKFEALLYCGKSIPEEKIEKPTGLPATALPVGNKPRCFVCEAKGAVECPTCAGTGLYVDAVLESQGVIVRVRCLGAEELSHTNGEEVGYGKDGLGT